MAETTTTHLKEHLPAGRKRELLVVAGQEVSCVPVFVLQLTP